MSDVPIATRDRKHGRARQDRAENRGFIGWIRIALGRGEARRGRPVWRGRYTSEAEKVERYGGQLLAAAANAIASVDPELRLHPGLLAKLRNRYWSVLERLFRSEGRDEAATLRRVRAIAAAAARAAKDEGGGQLRIRHVEEAVRREEPQAEESADPPVATAGMTFDEKAETIGNELLMYVAMGVAGVDASFTIEAEGVELARLRYRKGVERYAEDHDTVDSVTRDCMKQVGKEAAEAAQQNPHPGKPNTVTKDHLLTAFLAAEQRTQQEIDAGAMPSMGGVCS